MVLQRTMRAGSAILMIISILIAAMLSILPIPLWLTWYYPLWLTLILIYWQIVRPELMNLVMAWFIGIGADLLYNGIIGQYALIFVVLLAIVQWYAPRINLFTWWQQALGVLVLVLIEQLLRVAIHASLEITYFHWYILLPAFTTALMWPCVFKLLQCTAHGT